MFKTLSHQPSFQGLCYFIYLLLSGAGPCWAQASPMLDPSFQAPALFQTATVLGALQLSDGTRIVAGSFSRADGVASSGLVHYLASGAVDAGFSARTRANTWQIRAVREAPGGKLLVQFDDTARVSGQLCASLVRLLPNGRRDSTFASPAVPFSRIDALLAQPDGTVLLAAGTQGLVRLGADGTLDTAFSQQYGQPFLGGSVRAVARQADGKLLVGGDFTAVQGAARPGLARLLPSGALDAAYQPALPTTASCTVLTIQPTDGQLLCCYYNTSATGPGSAMQLVRLETATGALDATFLRDPTVSLPSRSLWPQVAVQASGAILLAGIQTPASGGGGQKSFIIRLASTGAYDPTWQVPQYGAAGQVAASIQVLPSGQVLATAPAPKPFTSSPPATSVALLAEASGTYVPGAAPVLQVPGYVTSLALQPDGKIVVAGLFTEINGLPTNGLVRLLPSGAPDASFGAGCSPFIGLSIATGLSEPRVVLQPDGKLLVSGLSISTTSTVELVRLLPSGCPDPAFVPALQLGVIQSLALQADGKVLLTGIIQQSGTVNVSYVARLTASGGYDAAYQLASGASVRVPAPGGFVAQSDGSAVLLNGDFGGTSFAVAHLQASGAFDPGFQLQALAVAQGAYSASANGLVRDAAGRQLLFGAFAGAGNVASAGVMRLLATGTPDASFQASLITTGTAPVITAVAEQPNGRLLVGGSGSFGLQRLLPDGQLDGSFDVTQGPSNGQVRALALQPDGAVLVGGTFTQVGTQPHAGLARLLSANVLHTSTQQAAVKTLAYPVPAHDQLHLRLDAASQPRQVQLLDALGRTVLTQAALSQTELTLNTAALPAGTYLLRVDYARSGPVTRRVVVE